MAADVARHGVVASFDERRGLGEVEDTSSGERFSFHCARIIDGSRTVTVGQSVGFEVVPGHLGRWEASVVEKR